MNRDYCYECDRETQWSDTEVCQGCGRTWGHPLLVEVTR